MSPVHDSYGKQVGAGLDVPAPSKLGGLPADTLGEQCDPKILRGCHGGQWPETNSGSGGPKPLLIAYFAYSHIRLTSIHPSICSYSHNTHMRSHRCIHTWGSHGQYRGRRERLLPQCLISSQGLVSSRHRLIMCQLAVQNSDWIR